jgi:recombination protein RecR
MKYPAQIQRLIEQFAQLPTVGPKTAERYVFYLLRQSTQTINELAASIQALPETIITCANCQVISTASPCPICADRQRDASLLCIVADTKDMYALEDIHQYHGYYHVLNSGLDPLRNNGLDKANLELLIQKLKTGQVTELLLALNPDMVGNTTALYLTKLLKPLNLKITRLAQGLPTGSNLEYADEQTLANALKYRNRIE